MRRNIYGKGDAFLLRITLILSAIIIFSNFLIGISVPILVDLDDEIAMFDTLWRAVVGQRIGIDYHNPLGFGPYQLGALLWHWLGPHYFVMRLAITLFSLSIAFCGCIVAHRVLPRRAVVALLFCLTLAFQLSAPTSYESRPFDLTMAGFHNRLIVAALAVLFLQVFGGGSKLQRAPGVEIAITVFLLNVLFLIKISGFLLGLMILLAGSMLRGRTAQRLLYLCAALIAFSAITAIEFMATGLEFIPVIRDYEVAAHARLAYSFYDVVSGLFSWPIEISVSLLVLFVVSQRFRAPTLDYRCIALIIGSYAACQFAINMTNSWNPSMWLAPSAMASLVACMGMNPIAHAGGSESWWRRLTPLRLGQISVEEAIPLLIFTFVLVPQVVASIVGISLGAAVSLGFRPSYAVTAGNGVAFRSMVSAQYWPRTYDRSLNEAVGILSSLNLGKEAIANLDFSNPFPVLFLAPPPKGIHVWWDFGFSVPRGAALHWQDVIGDACVVTMHSRTAVKENSLHRLFDIVRSKLSTDFEIVHQNKNWTIYRRTKDCTTAPRS